MNKQNNKLLNFDTISATKYNLNTYQVSFKIDPMKLIKKIYLKSLELPITVDNFRAPYSTFYYSLTFNNITTLYNFTLPDKTYVSIFNLLSDLNASCVLNIQPKLQANEICPIFSTSITELNKINMTIVMNNTTFNLIDNGIIKYYLGYNTNAKITTTQILLQKTTIYNFHVVYNLVLDNYYNFIFNNINTISKNNDNSQSDYKLCINSLSNNVYFANELTSFQQHVLITDKNLILNKLDIIITDKYNFILTSYMNWSFTLEFEYY